jgi:hypothetical protein
MVQVAFRRHGCGYPTGPSGSWVQSINPVFIIIPALAPMLRRLMGGGK